MAYKWINPNGVLTVGKKRIRYGKDIPPELPKARLKEFIKLELVGDLKELVPLSDSKTAALELQTSKLKEDNSALKDKIKELESESEGALKDEVKALQDEIKLLKKDNKK